jgi:hypothetical protein
MKYSNFEDYQDRNRLDDFQSEEYIDYDDKYVPTFGKMYKV